MVDDFVYQLDATIDDGNTIEQKTLICTSNFSYIIKEVFSFLMEDSSYKTWFVVEVNLKCWMEGKLVDDINIIEWEYDINTGGKHKFLEHNFRACVPKDHTQEYQETVMVYKLIKIDGE